MKDFTPTYLMIKRHTVTGLLYFCKTTRPYEEMLKYKGSGTRWNNHLKVHGRKYVETPWYCLFEDKEEIQKFALMCSNQWDIMNAKSDLGIKIWANKKLEDGLMGGGNGGANKGMSHPSKGKKIAAISLALLGNTNGKGGVGISKNKGVAKSKESVEKRANSNRGQTRTDVAKKNMSKGMTGIKKGPQEIVKCPHCPIEGGISAMKRSHFDNCKKRIK